MIEITVIILGVLLTLVSIGFIALLIYHLYYASEYPKNSVKTVVVASGPAGYVSLSSTACPYIGLRYKTTDAELLKVFQALQKTMQALQAKECEQIRSVFGRTKDILFQKIDADSDITKGKCDKILDAINLELDTLKSRVNPEYDATIIINELKNAYRQVLEILCVNNMNGTVSKEKLKLFIEQVVTSICPT